MRLQNPCESARLPANLSNEQVETRSERSAGNSSQRAAKLRDRSEPECRAIDTTSAMEPRRIDGMPAMRPTYTPFKKNGSHKGSGATAKSKAA